MGKPILQRPSVADSKKKSSRKTFNANRTVLTKKMVKGILKTSCVTNSQQTLSRKKVNTYGNVFVRKIPGKNTRGVVLLEETSTRSVMEELQKHCLADVPTLYVYSARADMWQRIVKFDSRWRYRTVQNQMYIRRHMTMSLEDIVKNYGKKIPSQI